MLEALAKRSVGLFPSIFINRVVLKSFTQSFQREELLSQATFSSSCFDRYKFMHISLNDVCDQNVLVSVYFCI